MEAGLTRLRKEPVRKRKVETENATGPPTAITVDGDNQQEETCSRLRK